MVQEYDTVFGVLLVASWVNSLLYTLEASQARRYFKSYSDHDPALIRWMVGLCLFLNGVNLLAECACVYLYTVTHWGDAIYVRHQDWPIPMYVMATSMTGFVVQSFLIRRYYYLSKKALITWSLVLLSLGAIGGAFSSAIIIILHDDYRSRHIIFIPITIWLVLSAATDCAIAAALVIQLYRMKSGFKSSESLIRRITVTTIQTGAATSVLVITALGAFAPVINSTSNVSTSLCFPLGCVYSLTMLYNLNERSNLSGSNPDAHTASAFQGEPGSLGLNLTALLAKHADTVIKTGSQGFGQRQHHPAVLRSDNTTTAASPPFQKKNDPDKIEPLTPNVHGPSRLKSERVYQYYSPERCDVKAVA